MFPSEAAEEKRSTALFILQAFVWLIAVLPARLVIGPIGAFGSPASLVGILAFLFWASGALGPGTLVRKVQPVRIAVIAFWIMTLGSYAVLHLNPVPTDEANAADRWILFTLVWSGVALLGAEGLRNVSEVLRLMRVVVAGAAASAFVAVLQSRLDFDLTLKMAKIPGLSVAGELQSVLTRSGLLRPAGTATHPIEFGCMLAMTLGLAIVLATHDRGWEVKRRWAALGLISLGIPIAVSRSAILGAAIVGLFWFAAAEPKQRLRAFAWVVMLSTAIFLTSPGLIGTLKSYFVNAGSDSSITTRTDDYSAVAQYVRRSPIIGRGPATFLPKYRILDNTWLTTIIEMGVVGIIGLLIYYFSIGAMGRGIRRRSRDPLLRALGQALVGLSVVVAFDSLTFDFYAYPMDPGFFSAILGMTGAVWAITRQAELAASVPVDAGRRAREALPERRRVAALLRVGGNEVRTDSPGHRVTLFTHGPAAVLLRGGGPVGFVQRPAQRGSSPTNGSSVSIRRRRPPPATGPPPSGEADLGRSARKALRWSMAAQLVARAGSFMLGLVLARLLTPHEFGTYTVALGTFLILLTVDDLGILKGLVRWPGSFDEAMPTARVLGTLSGLTVYAAIFLLAPVIASTTSSPAATGVIRLLCLGLLIDAGWQIVPGAALQRGFRQDLWVLVELCRLVVMAGVTIALAAGGAGVWSLAWGSLAGQVAMAATTTALARVPVRYGYNRAVARELVRVSAPYAGAALVGAALLNVDYLVIGRQLGPAAVGVYLIAFNVSSWPVSLVSTAVRAVSIPGFARLNDRGGDVGNALRRALTMLIGGALPFIALVIAVPALAIRTLYGSEWVGGANALRFLALLAIVRLIDGLVDDALFAGGKSPWILRKNIIWLVALVVALPIGAHLDDIRGVGVAHALVGLALILPIIGAYLVKLRLFRASLLGSTCAMGVAAAAAGLAGWWLSRQLELPDLVRLGLAATGAVAVYAGLVLPFRRRLLTE